jgi:glucosamine kinase
MILIADSGSTKTSWCLLDKEKRKLHFSTEGYNPYYIDASYITASLQPKLPPDLNTSAIQQVYFYGAGCYAEKAAIVKQGLAAVFPGASIEVDLDILAASRALLGNKPGFVSILGTGTNTCIYDGQSIVQNVDSLGFILGDEGSGAYMGKKFLSDLLRNKIPVRLQKAFAERFQLERPEIFDSIYHQPYPNRFCAGFAGFVLEHAQQEAYCDQLIAACFSDFFERLVTAYPGFSTYSFNCVGSVAFHFRKWLIPVAARYGMETGKIVDAPIDELVLFHEGY